MTVSNTFSPEMPTSPAFYPAVDETRQLRPNSLRFFRTVAESVGVQGPTGGAVIAAAVLAGVSGGGTALVQTATAVAMGFVAYAFVIFTRGFNSAGSVYGFTGAVAGPRFGFCCAWALLLVYVSFAGGICTATADEAQSAFASVGLHLSWQVYAGIAFLAVMLLAYLDIKVSAAVILAVEGASMLLVTIACAIVLAKGGFQGHAFSSAPFRPNGASFSTLTLGIVLSFSTFSGFEAASTLGEESRQPRRVIPLAIATSLVVVAIFEIGVTAVVTNAYPSTEQLSSASVPLVTVTDQYVSSWMGDVVNFGAAISAFGAALACAVAASRMLFALGRDAGPEMLGRTSARTGSPVGALTWVGVGSALTVLLVLRERLATRAVVVSLTYGSDLIIAAYIMVVVAALIYCFRRHMSAVKMVILLAGLVVLGCIVKGTLVPLPAAPFRWDALAAGVTLIIGVALPFVYPPLRRGIYASPLLRAGAMALLGSSDAQAAEVEAISPRPQLRRQRRIPPSQRTG